MRCAPESLTQQPPVAEEAQQACEAGRGNAGAGVAAAHMVDHDRQANGLQDRHRVRQILDVDPKLQVPAELVHDRRKHPRGVERHAAAIMQLAATEEMVEPQAADAEPMPAAKLRRRHVGVGDRNAAQPAGLACQRIQHRGIVGPVRAALHQNAAGKAEGVEHGKIFFERRVRRGVAAIGGVGKARRRPEHMGMGVAGSGRERNLGPARRARGGTGEHDRTLS